LSWQEAFTMAANGVVIFTLSDQAFDHLTAIAHDGAISRSETLERLVRSTDIGEGSSLLSDDAWPFVIDHCSPS
jgi:hypothetical protein